jgi:hypothetical protein
MSEKKIVDIQYPVGVEFFVPSQYAPIEEQQAYRKIQPKKATPYVPDIEVGDMVRWNVPAGKGKPYSGIPFMTGEPSQSRRAWWRQYDYSNLLRYEDIALVLTKSKDNQYLFVHTNHGMGWIETRLVSRVNKR